jgi:hypothetical protein
LSKTLAQTRLERTIADTLAKGSASAARWKSRCSGHRVMPLPVKERQNEASGRTRIREQCGLTQSRQTSISSNSTAALFGSETSTNDLVSQQERKRRRGDAGMDPAAPFGDGMTVLLSPLF